MNKYWAPLKSVQEYVKNYCIEKKYKKILEVCPGGRPFELSTHFIHGIGNREPASDINLEIDPFPFEDNEFDFVYCRHVVEDLGAAGFFIKELSRVGVAGYIETPSPIAELTKKVDLNSPEWRGYIHHRWIVWSNKNKLKLLAKYPAIEYMKITDFSQKLSDDAVLWNTYFFWEGSIDYKIFLNGLDYNVFDHYAIKLDEAINEYTDSIKSFKQKL